MSRYCMIPAILYSGEGKTMEIIIIKKISSRQWLRGDGNEEEECREFLGQ